MTGGDLRLGVVYDEGAASYGEVHASLAAPGSRIEPVYLLPGSAHADAARPGLCRLGEVVDLPQGDSAGGRNEAADREAVEGLGLSGVVTYSELALARTATIAAALGTPGTTPETAALLRDKLAQRRRLAGAGVDSVHSVLVSSPVGWESAVDEVGLPGVLKPRHGVASRATHLVRTVADVRRGAELVEAGSEEFVFEELLVGADTLPFGDYVSVESLVQDGAVTHVAVTGKLPLVPPFREVAQFWPAPLADELADEVRRLSGAALQALGLRHGLAHTEVKLTAYGPRIIEVNGRLGGLVGELSQRAAGVDLVRAAADVALGRPHGVRPVEVDRVHFQYTSVAPPFEVTFGGVRGARELLRRPGFSRYLPHVRRGAVLAGGVATTTLDLVAGEADDLDGLLQAVRTLERELVYEFGTPGGGSVSLSAGELATAAPGATPAPERARAAAPAPPSQPPTSSTPVPGTTTADAATTKELSHS
ncbi:ATP-grasp domain-containing protein [Pedococcus sp. 2YAF34]|uniref:ATP-grasp domain-containing protein n=1 Tax=Pedococcus sp. 2YAF34 TaxID=3233032 RepID=UPI003F95E98C